MRRLERQDSYRELLATLVGAEPVGMSKVESTLVQTVESMLEPMVELMLEAGLLSDLSGLPVSPCHAL